LAPRLQSLNPLAGCCGTDHRHVEQIALTFTLLFGAHR
jgi:methionine synthase I (cobalamin-dependent)